LFRIALNEESAKEEIQKVKANNNHSSLEFLKVQKKKKKRLDSDGIGTFALTLPGTTTTRKRQRSVDCILNSVFSFHSIYFK
jgi:hypothetical protein